MQGLYPAKVINNLDTKKKGRVQIKIEHLHYDIIDKDFTKSDVEDILEGDE